MSSPKEPGYHARDLPMVGRIEGIDDYARSFDASADVSYRCDATPWYLYSVKAAASIHDMAPDARLVVRLRNPVDMLASLHNHHRYVGIEREASFEKAVFTPRRPDPTDFRHHLDYLGVASVGEQVRRYVETFSREQIYFMRFDVASKDPERSHLGLLDWLGLEPTPLESYQRLNRARHPRIRQLRPITDWMVQKDKPRPVRAVGYRLRKVNTLQGRSGVAPEIRRRILDTLRDDITLLSEISGFDLRKAWLDDGRKTG